MKKLRLLAVLFGCIVLGLSVDARGQAVEWVRQLGTGSDDVGYGVAADSAGGVYVTGYTWGSLFGNNEGYADAVMVKYDSNGTLDWQTQWGTVEMDEGRAVTFDGQENLYACGTTQGTLGATGYGDWDAFTRRYNTSGSLAWTEQWGTDDSERGWDVAGNVQGGAYMFGALYDFYLVRYATDGSIVWERELGSSGLERQGGVATDAQGGAYIAGSTMGSLAAVNDGYYWDAVLARYNADGTLDWKVQPRTSAHDLASAVAVDDQGNAFLVGETYGAFEGTNAGWTDLFLMKYDSSGNLIWTTQMGTENSDNVYGVAVDSQGYIYVTGSTYEAFGGPHLGGSDAYVIKFNPDGTVAWSTQFGSEGSDEAHDITIDDQDNIYVTGCTYGSYGCTNEGGLDIFLVKINPVPEPGMSGLLLGLAWGLLRRVKRQP